MKLEDYKEYYIQGSDHYLIPKDTFEELFNEMINWKEESNQLKQENEQLKKMVNFGGITIVNCPECNKEINVNFCRETEEYRKKYEQLKDRMEKARIFVQQNIRDIDYDCEEYDYLMELLGNGVNE